MGFASALIRRRGSSNFDPTDRLSSLRGWWSVPRGLVTSSGNFASLTDLSGLGHTGLPVAGKNLPAIVAASTLLGNKRTLQFSRDGVGQPVYFAGVNLAPPFTVYIAMAIGAGVGINQLILDGPSAAPRVYTYPGGPPDSLVQVGSAQAITGINLTNSVFALTLVFNASGSLSGAAKSSEVLDYTLDLGTFSATGFYFGQDNGFTAAYALDGELAELIIVDGVDTILQQHGFLSYFQGEYGFGVDFTPPGTLFRSKYAVHLDSTPSAYPVQSITPLVTPTSALRIYERFTPVTATVGRAQFLWAQHNSGAGPEVRESVDGTLTVTSASVSYASELSIFYDPGHDVEIFSAVAGGALPELAVRLDGPSGAWMPIPLPGAATMAALVSPSGNVNFGGDASGASVNGIFREVVAFTDGAQPIGYRAPTYSSGVIAIVGESLSLAGDTGAWPLLALRDVTKAHPVPRLVGLSTDSYELINTRFASAIAPLIVGGGMNVLIIGSGARQSIVVGGDSAATAFSALQTLCTTARTAGFNKIIVNTSMPSTGYTDATRAAFNALCTGGGLATYADSVADVASDATIGVTGAYTNTTYYRTNQIGLTLAGGRLFAAPVATALSAVLP